MATIGSLVVNLVANTTQFAAGLKKGSAEAKSFESRITSMAGKVGIALTGVGATVAAGHFLKGAIQEAMEGQKEMAQLAAVIKSTGAAAGFSVKQIDDFANSLQETTTFSDGATKSAAALLMTFTNIKGDVFKEAIQSAQDMSIAMGSDLNGSIIQLGKALNDPIKGITALSRVGVSFTDDQKKMIKGFVEANDVMSAQKIILAELAKEFGGSAAAALDTTAGKLEKLKNKWDALKGDIGKAAMPAADVAIEGATTGVGWYKSYQDWWAGEGGNNFLNMRSGSGNPNGNNNSYLKDIPKLANVQGFAAQFNGLSSNGKIPEVEKLSKGVSDRFSKALGAAFDAQFVGTNREDMFKNAREWGTKRITAFGKGLNSALSVQFGGSSNLGVFNAMRGGSTPAVKTNRKMSGAYRNEALERGSSAAFSAILQSKSNPAIAFHETAKKQLVVQQQIAANTGKANAAAPAVVTIGGA